VVDVTVNGVHVQAGTTLCQHYGAANRDPEVFADPDTLDVTRPNARDHVAIGYGPHYCLGQALARLEGEIFFRTLTRRFPQLELASDDHRWAGNAEFRTLTRLPVAVGC
jgi:cytochrome P450